jgi:hypothetical protein
MKRILRLNGRKGQSGGQNAATPESSEPFRNVPKGVEEPKAISAPVSESENDRLKELAKENLDLKITNQGKDFFIEQLQKCELAFSTNFYRPIARRVNWKPSFRNWGHRTGQTRALQRGKRKKIERRVSQRSMEVLFLRRSADVRKMDGLVKGDQAQDASCFSPRELCCHRRA